MVIKKFLTPNPYTRTQWSLYDRLGIVIHGTGTPGQTARGVWDYFEHDCVTLKRKVSAHFVVDSKEVLQLIPLTEEAFHLRYPRADAPYKGGIESRFGNNPSKTLIGIELCHPDESGCPDPVTLQRAVMLCYELCDEHKKIHPLHDIIRHFDVTGKSCPLWYVKHPALFMQFQLKVKEHFVYYERFKHQPQYVK